MSLDSTGNMLVSEAMVKDPYSISPERTVQDAYHLMRAHRIGGLPVVDNGKLVGIITIFDLKNSHSNENAKIKDVMSKNLVIAYPDENIEDVRKRLSERRIARIPVVSRQDPRTLVGLLAHSQFDDHPDMILCEYHSGTVSRKSIRNGKCQVCGAPIDLNKPVMRK